jgi:glycerophosphoryl diester phosphodiesterase
MKALPMLFFSRRALAKFFSAFVALAFCSLLLFSTGGCTSVSLEKSKLIAHRGMSEIAPENTLVAYKEAVERGFSFECDVYKTKDGKVFSFHDNNLKRIAGINKRCEDCTWEEVKNLDVGAWKGEEWKGQHPASLEDILLLARNGRIIEIDVKSGPEIVPVIKNIVLAQTNATPKNIVFASSRINTIRAIREEMPEFPAWIGVTCRRGWGKQYPPLPVEEAIEKARASKANGIALQFDPELITKEYIKTLQDAGYHVNVWTIDCPKNASCAAERGADTITSNRPNKLLQASSLAL